MYILRWGGALGAVCYAIEQYKYLVEGRVLEDILRNMVAFFEELIHEPHLRWVSIAITQQLPQYSKLQMICHVKQQQTLSNINTS